uniref:Uncharacterized protein n=1 Tax=Pyxicephalus adspersus TaxID=30357 RepID=A0AAV2ZGD2_PYXAD|nr:TPA: hypothetical protein GDO54_003325 [Pyxicephalus adspersus]
MSAIPDIYDNTTKLLVTVSGTNEQQSYVRNIQPFSSFMYFVTYSWVKFSAEKIKTFYFLPNLPPQSFFSSQAQAAVQILTTQQLNNS